VADPVDRFGAAAIPEDQRPLTRARLAAALVVPGLAAALLVHNARGTYSSADAAEELERRLTGFRGWDDIAIAGARYASGDYPVAAYEIANRNRRDLPDFLAYRDELLRELRRARVRPQQFWRTIDASAFKDDARVLARRWDDSGRVLLLALGFQGLGGIAPFLLFWLGILAALPVLVWLGAELCLAGRPPAAAALLALVASSAFVIDLLMLDYSAAGFSLLAVLLVALLAAYAFFGMPRPRGLLLRALLAGLLFGWFTAARSGSLLTLAGVVPALLVASWRALPAARPSRRAALALAALVLYAAPCALPPLLHERWLQGTLGRLQIYRKPKAVHDVWVTLWQGLGDFDRSKGHTFLDKAGELEAKKHGSPLRLSERSEELFRSLLLRDVREDPLWYAGILAKRTLATLTLRKLWPWGPLDGKSFAEASHPAEGVTDNYWGMTQRADFFRLGRSTWEAPMPLLLLPTLGLLGFALVAREPLRADARRGVGVTACVALAALPAPVLVSTAAGFEAETFVIAHLTGAAFFAECGFYALRRAAAARAGSRR